MLEVKKSVGRYAGSYVEDGMVVGLGTGSTAHWFIDEVGRRYQAGELKNILCVSTSEASSQQARELGLPLKNLEDVNAIDLLVDGADETTRQFAGIKGGGGALLHEKITAEYAHKIVWIIDESKLVDQLGKFPLPVEVVQFGSWKLFDRFQERGMNPSFRKDHKDSLFITDSGNYIIDLHLEQIPYPEKLAQEIKQMVGVVEHGLFLDYATTILVGKQDGTIMKIERSIVQA
ncbi:MAG: ribose-5-phosphate isomerase RpiA [Facklamia hominis]|uniref:ribose-5-phosphate isomerase RpiA n=1 Tax=Facklamia hominis TaxID=178214 RepID=UPI00035395DB|nr:ribose-5-phosphate isomerase RpiA [Facklamia hominis]EPH08692.1 ribose 5-phosphate isomerase A [Facklamia hominis ACS-120-V-Sch10]PKY92850.1 ribose-5-phosphate isomerase RpiA [Facklamia hominis]